MPSAGCLRAQRRGRRVSVILMRREGRGEIVGVHMLAGRDVLRRLSDRPTVLADRGAGADRGRGKLVSAGHEGFRDQRFVGGSDRFAGLQIAQGNQHVVPRVHSQHVGNRYHISMVTGIRICANSARRPELCAVGRAARGRLRQSG